MKMTAIAKMLLFVATLAALSATSNAQVFGYRNRMLSGHLVKQGYMHPHQHHRRLKSGELTADIFQQTNEYDRELMGDLPDSCDSVTLQVSMPVRSKIIP